MNTSPLRNHRPRTSLATICILALSLAGAFASVPALAAPPFKYEQALSEKLATTLGEAVPGAFHKPWGMAFDGGGHLFVAEANPSAIYVFDATDALTGQLGAGVFPSEQFDRSVAVNDATGVVYVAESAAEEVFVFKPEGGGTYKLLQQRKFGGFMSVAVDNSTGPRAGDVYVISGQSVKVVKTSAAGELEAGEEELPPPEEGFALTGNNKNAEGLAVEASTGTVYLAEPGHGVVSKYDAAGVRQPDQLTGAGVPGGGAFEPTAVALDEATGDIYVVDEAHNVIDAFSSTGTYLNHIAQKGTEEPFHEARGVAVQQTGANAGDVYVSEGEEPGAVDVFRQESVEAPTMAGTSVTEVSGDSANLSAELAPHGAVTKYHFQYGACGTAETCATSPYTDLPASTVGSEEDFATYTVSAALKRLSSDTTYHVRLVASNSHGEATSQEQTFTTQQPGGELVLPDGRQWELVSPPNKHGGLITGIDQAGVIATGSAGNAIAYFGNAPIESEPPGGAGTAVQVLATRGPSGWTSHNLANSHEAATGGGGDHEEYPAFSADLTTAILQPWGSFDPTLSEEASEQTPFLRTLIGCTTSCYRPLVTGKPAFANVPPDTHFGEEAPCAPGSRTSEGHNQELMCGPKFVDATPDLRHVILESNTPLTPGAPAHVIPAEAPERVSGSNLGSLYEWEAGALQLVSVLPQSKKQEEKGEEVALWPGYQPRLGSRMDDAGFSSRAVSADGSRVFWHPLNGDLIRADRGTYVRDTVLHKTLQLDTAEPSCVAEGCGSGGGVFQTASTDGSRVFFSDEDHKLTGDAGAGNNLYECKIVVEAGRLSCDLTDLTPMTGGRPTAMLGEVLGASEDGSYVYFVAQGVLTAAPNARGEAAAPGDCRQQEGSTKQVGACNLYMRHDGTTTFIARLAGRDLDDWAGNGRSPAAQPVRVSPNGHWVEFMSERPLTGYDNRDTVSGQPDAEIFLYAAETGRIICASCDPTGSRPVGIEAAHLAASTGSSRLLAGASQWYGEGWVAALPPQTMIGTYTPADPARFLTDTGRLFMNVLGGLVPQDVNGTGDVYEYEPLGTRGPAGEEVCTSAMSTYSRSSDGCVALISSGTSSEQSEFLGASESGDDAFFRSSARLTPQDVDSSSDVYDAHVCSSAAPCAPSPPSSPLACVTEASCRPAPSPQPPIFGLPSSATFSGLGNLVSPLPQVPVASLTRAQVRARKLAQALKTCRKQRPRGKRVACERLARRRYGAHSSGRAKHASRPAHRANRRSK